MKFSIKNIVKKVGKKNEKINTNDEIYQRDTNQARNFIKQFKLEEKIIGNRQNGIVEKYRDGKILSQTPYCDGKIDGIVYTYFEDGSVESIQTYKNGVLNGMSIIYDRRGKIIYNSEYENGDRIGYGNLINDSYLCGEDRHI